MTESGAEVAEDVLVPYSDIDAEASVISAVTLDPAAMPKVVDFLSHEHFFSEAHRRIFEACRALFFAKEPIDMVTIASWIRARGRIGQVGGIPYMMQIADATPAPANVRGHAVAVHDAWRRRQVMLSCQRIAIQAARSVGDVQAWCEASVRALGEISLENPVKPVETSEQALSRVLRDALLEEDAAPEPGAVSLTGFPMGLFGLDRILGGLRKSAKTTIVASTGVGKTAFAIQASVALAKQGVGVLFFSKELKRDEVMRRALLQESNVSSNRIRQRRLTSADRKDLIAAEERLKKLPMIVDESPRLTIEQLSSIARTTRDTMLHQYRVPLGMIVDDYVQRCDPSKRFLGQAKDRGRHEELGWHTKHFKTLCQELDVVGLELAQQKDPVPGRKPEKPRGGAGISDSSQIGKEADDIVYLLAETNPDPKDPRVEVEAWVAKNRAGQKNVGVSLVFRGDTYRFTDPNTPNAMAAPSRQYVDTLPEPPAGRFDDDGSSTLTRGL